MRTCLALAILALVPTRAAAQRVNLDAPVDTRFRITPLRLLRPCDLGFVVAQIGHALKVPVGFESTPDCPLTFHGGPGPGSDTEDLAGKSPREAFDYLMTVYPEFSWKDMDGVIVVRPKAAWDDPNDVLHYPTASFQSADQPLDDALHALLRAVSPSAFSPHDDLANPDRPINRRVTVLFRGGTMLDALNTVVRSCADLDWQLGYYAGPGHADLLFGTSDYRTGVVAEPAIRK